MSRRSRNADPEQVTFEVTEASDGEYDANFTQALTQTKFTFSQVDADPSQFLDSARDAEKRKLDGIGAVARNKIVTDLSRILLFKGLAGACIDKTKVTAEALGDDMKGERIQGAVLGEAEKRLRDVFGFGVRRVPAKMEEDLPSRFKNRLYLINDVTDNDEGLHSLNIHYADKNGSNEKGVLMMVLAFAFCKGTSQIRSGQMKGAGKKTRWITEHQLYALLNRVDENIPSEPPSATGRRGRKSRTSMGGDEEGVGQTPDVDALLNKFVDLDYLLRDKIEEPESAARETQGANDDGKVLAYAMGPRAAIEVGRKQVIYFCASILGEQPDPTMLKEVDEDDEVEEEESDEEREEEKSSRKKRRRS
mmetsp:Transcript_31712/g.72519  ORF Transcript_31712/g.72519 Transcript_31712/m.72519 type:complete len:363 (+) Transcript_31712:80-1168(+)